MYKYNMTINGESYMALFFDHIEAADFLDANDREGNTVVVNGYKFVTATDVINDDDFEEDYKLEMAGLAQRIG